MSSEERGTTETDESPLQLGLGVASTGLERKEQGSTEADNSTLLLDVGVAPTEGERKERCSIEADESSTTFSEVRLEVDLSAPPAPAAKLTGGGDHGIMNVGASIRRCIWEKRLRVPDCNEDRECDQSVGCQNIYM